MQGISATQSLQLRMVFLELDKVQLRRPAVGVVSLLWSVDCSRILLPTNHGICLSYDGTVRFERASYTFDWCHGARLWRTQGTLQDTKFPTHLSTVSYRHDIPWSTSSPWCGCV